jgi:hypothetical protein
LEALKRQSFLKQRYNKQQRTQEASSKKKAKYVLWFRNRATVIDIQGEKFPNMLDKLAFLTPGVTSLKNEP